MQCCTRKPFWVAKPEPQSCSASAFPYFEADAEIGVHKELRVKVGQKYNFFYFTKVLVFTPSIHANWLNHSSRPCNYHATDKTIWVLHSNIDVEQNGLLWEKCLQVLILIDFLLRKQWNLTISFLFLSYRHRVRLRCSLPLTQPSVLSQSQTIPYIRPRCGLHQRWRFYLGEIHWVSRSVRESVRHKKWKTAGRRLENTWKTPGIHLRDAWDVPER